MKIIWFLEKQFDTALDTATWVEMIKHLQKNHDVTLFTGFRKNQVQFKALKNEITYTASPPIPILKRAVFYKRQIILFKQVVKKLQPDIVLLNTMNLFLLKTARKLQSSLGYKLILDIRTLTVYTSFIIRSIEKVLFKKCLCFAAASFDGISYITEDIMALCQEKYGLKQHHSLVWQSSVNIDVFKPQKRASNPEFLHLLYHGSITESRQVGNLLEAMNQLDDLKVKLVLLGDGIGIGRLKELALRMNLGNRVEFLPRVSYYKVPEYINNADVGIIPFKDCPVWNTSSPIKLFEYLACEKPVLVTKIPAHTAVLEAQDFVIWMNSPEPGDIADSIRTAYSLKHKLKSMGKKAREFVSKNYTWDIQAKKLEKFFRE